jgi:phage terminase large subunit GpA-like protein
MQTAEQIELRRLQRELTDLNIGLGHPKIRPMIRKLLDAVRPAEDISTNETAKEYRKLPTIGGGKADFDPNKAPYLAEIHDAMDSPTTRRVFVKGPTRCGKTTAPENFLLKVAMFGPSRNMLWYMHSEPDLKRYVTERVDFFLREHEEVAEKVGGRGGRAAWNLKMVDGAVWEWLPANPSTTRARSAAIVVCDEVDAMRPAIGDAIVSLVENRQREYGALAKAFFCSHPDRGPLFGIDRLIKGSDFRVRVWTCEDCGHLMSPCVEDRVPRNRRITWNLDRLMVDAEELTRDELVEHVTKNVCLECPNCKTEINDEDRLRLDAAGVWMPKGQDFGDDESIVGEPIQSEAAGFVIHAFMAPFVTLPGLAEEFVDAWLARRDTGSDNLLKEVYVKSLGETYRGDDEASKQKPWKEFKAAHLDTGYVLSTVPAGVDFLSGMVDVQGKSFEFGGWGWSRRREGWLVERFSLKQRLGLRDINPGDNLDDWDVLEHVLNMTWPLNDGSGRHLRLAKLAIDTGGVPGVTENARLWAANMLAAGKVEPWRLMLSKGDAHLKGALYGHVNKIKEDKGGRELPVPVLERVVNVSEVKRVMATRYAIEAPGPGFIHIPKDLDDRYVKELVSETFVNGLWYRQGANETWDTLIMSEVARALLAPENAGIDWVNDRPSFAIPFIPSSPDANEGDNARQERDFFSRLRDVNRRGR